MAATRGRAKAVREAGRGRGRVEERMGLHRQGAGGVEEEARPVGTGIATAARRPEAYVRLSPTADTACQACLRAGLAGLAVLASATGATGATCGCVRVPLEDRRLSDAGEQQQRESPTFHGSFSLRSSASSPPAARLLERRQCCRETAQIEGGLLGRRVERREPEQHAVVLRHRADHGNSTWQEEGLPIRRLDRSEERRVGKE